MRLLIFFIILLSVTNISLAASLPKKMDEVRNYALITEKLATGGALYSGALNKLRKNGFKSVIDLRTAPEGTAGEEILFNNSGIKYYNLETTGALALTPDHAMTFAKIYEQAEKPVLVHCASGNRVGTLWTSMKLQQYHNPEKSFEEGRKMGMKPMMEEALKERMGLN